MSWSGMSLCPLTATSFPCCENLLLTGLAVAYMRAAPCCSADSHALACSHLIPKDLLISKGKDSVLLPPQYRQFYTKVRPDPVLALRIGTKCGSAGSQSSAAEPLTLLCLCLQLEENPKVALQVAKDVTIAVFQAIRAKLGDNAVVCHPPKCACQRGVVGVWTERVLGMQAMQGYLQPDAAL